MLFLLLSLALAALICGEGRGKLQGAAQVVVAHTNAGAKQPAQSIVKPVSDSAQLTTQASPSSASMHACPQVKTASIASIAPNVTWSRVFKQAPGTINPWVATPVQTESC